MSVVELSASRTWWPKRCVAGAVEPHERETIAFFVEAMRGAQSGEPILLFGVGPTLLYAFPAAEKASEIHVADSEPASLHEIERWIVRDPSAHDWRPFVRHTLQCEGIPDPSDEQVAAREELTRARITRLLHANPRDAAPVPERYGTVISAYGADSATGDRATWELLMRNISFLVRPGGLFITAARRRSPSPNIDEHDVRAVLEPAFGPLNGEIEVRDSGIILGAARRIMPCLVMPAVAAPST
jgi:hypothetical protein